MKILTPAEMREADRLTTERCNIPSLTLMENAGGSVAQFIKERWPDFDRRAILVLCGKGNNGGDGLVVARHLLEMGGRPEVVLLANPEEFKGDAAINLKRWQKVSGTAHRRPGATDWRQPLARALRGGIIIDAMLGTGIRGAAEGQVARVIEEVNGLNSGHAVVAVDIPSGLTGDNRIQCGPVITADFTITFTAPKISMFCGDAASRVGRLFAKDIGTPPEIIEEVGKSKFRWLDARELNSFAVRRKPNANKGDYGHALIVSGSTGKSGAAVLASWAALRSGAGLVTVATPEPVLPIVAARIPEVMTVPLRATDAGGVALKNFEDSRFVAALKGKSVLAMGPGLGTEDETTEFVRRCAGKLEGLPIILDADGLNAFKGRAQDLRGARTSLALTPHPGEMARLVETSSEDVQSRRLEVATKYAGDLNAMVILKGQQTIVAQPDGQAWINSTGNPGMGTAGTGDVLTGMLAGLTSQFGTKDWWRVLGLGVYLHGLAGDIAWSEAGETPILASDVIRAIPEALERFFAASGHA
jgi:NAD(P)H-hydrate epimerase